MGDMGDVFKDFKQEGKERRAHNREASAEILKKEKVSFLSKNGGAHLIVEGKNGLIDFWPGTGRWVSRAGGKGYGVFKLIKHLRRSSDVLQRQVPPGE